MIPEEDNVRPGPSEPGADTIPDDVQDDIAEGEEFARASGGSPPPMELEDSRARWRAIRRFWRDEGNPAGRGEADNAGEGSSKGGT
jgi:hypothetical protein